MQNKKVDKKRLASFFIGLSVFTLASISASFTIKNSLGEDSNLNYLALLFHRCEPLNYFKKEKNIILRIDDIQAFAWRDISIKMVNEAFKRKMPVVLAVIPVGLEKDRKIVNYLKKNLCNIEIAQHGWDNNIYNNPDIPEFGELNEKEAYERIIKGKKVLQKITKDPIITFIPPNNIYSSGTAVALEKTGFKIISNEGSGYFDYTASTYDFEHHKLTKVTEVINECKEGLLRKNLCIIMLHPQDYATEGRLDEEKYKNYLKLLDELEKMDVGFVKIKDLIN